MAIQIVRNDTAIWEEIPKLLKQKKSLKLVHKDGDKASGKVIKKYNPITKVLIFLGEYGNEIETQVSYPRMGNYYVLVG